jgi:hypothetical protein
MRARELSTKDRSIRLRGVWGRRSPRAGTSVVLERRLLMLQDGPLLEQSLKAVAGALIRLPRSKQHYLNRERLAMRFDQFKRAA